jgi:hypothetical protein
MGVPPGVTDEREVVIRPYRAGFQNPDILTPAWVKK